MVDCREGFFGSHEGALMLPASEHMPRNEVMLFLYDAISSRKSACCRISAVTVLTEPNGLVTVLTGPNGPVTGLKGLNVSLVRAPERCKLTFACPKEF